MLNTPYPELWTDTALAAEFAEWNAANERARREYEKHPTSACDHNGNCTRRYRRAQEAK